MEVTSEDNLLSLRENAAAQVSDYGFPGITIYVELGRTGIRGIVGVGFADLESGTKLTGKEPSRIASMTKTYTAAAVLRLTEMGRMGLDQSISDYLSAETVALLQSGGYNTSEITVRQLLQHTSGLAEHADDAYEAYIIQHPRHQWSRHEQIQWALDHSKPVGSPGQQFLYSDTGYVLLGEMIEGQTKLGQAAAFRNLLRYEQLGLHHTWFESLEPAPSDLPPLVHQLLGNLDTASFDPSFDLWGGGGLAATAEDAGRFLRALMTGKVFDHESTLTTMLSIPATNHQLTYGMGIFRIDVSDGKEKESTVFWGHSGHFGTAFWYCPAEDITFAYGRHQSIAPESGYNPHSLVAESVRIYWRACEKEHRE